MSGPIGQRRVSPSTKTRPKVRRKTIKLEYGAKCYLKKTVAKFVKGEYESDTYLLAGKLFDSREPNNTLSSMRYTSNPP